MAMYALIAGVALKALGSISDANSQAGQLKADASMQDRNALILDQRALTVGSEAARNEEAIRREGRAALGTQAAAAGEGGFNSSGSVLDLFRQSAKYAELDAQNVRYKGASEARGYRGEAQNARYQSELDRKMASRAKLSGYLNAAGTIAGGYALGASKGMFGGGGGLSSVNYTGGISSGKA